MSSHRLATFLQRVHAGAAVLVCTAILCNGQNRVARRHAHEEHSGVASTSDLHPTKAASDIAGLSLSLGPPVGYGTGGYAASGLAAADLNHDGKIDLVVGDSCAEYNSCYASLVGVVLGNGDGTFQAPTTYPLSGYNLAPQSVAISDLNGDGNLDIVVVTGCETSTSCTGVANILLGNGDGTFRAAVGYGTNGFSAQAVIVADVNGDGKLDLVVTNDCADANSCSNGLLSVLLGNGDGTFQHPLTNSAVGYSPRYVAAADFNRDGQIDLAIGNGGISVLLGNGDGTFQAPTAYSEGLYDVFAVATTDLNGDGKPDLQAAEFCQSQIGFCGGGPDVGFAGVLLGGGNGTFQQPVNYDAGNCNPVYITIGDFNLDGTPDIAVAAQFANGTCPFNGSVDIFLGNGDGSFQAGVNFSSGGYQPMALVNADFNGDGKPDLAASQCKSSQDCSGYVYVLLNSSMPSTNTTAASSVNPSSSGEQVTLTATVSAASGSGVPTGTASFMDGSTSLGSSTLTGAGVAAVTTSALSIGTHSITAVYSGDVNFAGSTSPILSQVVQGAIGAATPGAINFGNVTVGAVSASQTATLTNSGNVALTLTSIAVSITNGTYTQSNNCPSFLVAGASCTVTLTWSPATVTTMTGTLTFTDNASPATQVVALSGTGIAPSVSVSPSSLNFGNQTVGVTSTAKVVTVTNTGGAAVTISGFSFTGSNATDFGKTNTCGSSLAVGASCTVSVTYKPGAAGARSATLNITDSAGNSPQTVPLSGTGVTPSVSLTPSSLTFATQVVFTSSAGQVVTLKNTGLGSLTINNVAITSSFTQSKTCGASLAAGASCTITVKFNPQVKNTITGTLTVTDSAGGSPHKVALTGVGTYVQLSPTTLNFGNQPVGTTSLAKKVTLSNKGDGPVTSTSIAKSGTNAPDFTETNTCPISPATLASGASCFITTTFTPSAKGKRTGTISVNDDGGGSPQTINLSGSGT